MKAIIDSPRRLTNLGLDTLLTLFLLGLGLLIFWPTASQADSRDGSSARAERSTSSNLIPFQGTPVVAIINGSISGKDPTYIGQRHFRSGIRGERNCRLFGQVGERFYDEAFFVNNSSTTQTVTISFVSNCDANTYMAAYSPQFIPANICENYVAAPGQSASVDWDFTVCANSQFSIVVYGLEPGVLCESYSYTVFGNGISFIGSTGQGSKSETPGAKAGKEGDGGKAIVAAGGFTVSDMRIKKTKRKVRGTDVRFKRILPDGITSPLDLLMPEGGTPLVAMVMDSIDRSDRSFAGQRHFFGGIRGDANCSLSPPVGTRFYDEYFFVNNSSTSQRISIGFPPGCNLFMAAYSPQFNPNDICANFIASSGSFIPGNWEFTVCANAVFSIVVYNPFVNNFCPSYTYKVFGNGITFLGTNTDVAILKTGPAGPVSRGSNIAYTITVTNNGPAPARDMTISDTLPAGTTFVSLSLLSDPGTPLVCSTPPVGGTGTVTCSLGLLSTPGSTTPNSVSLSLVVNVTNQAPSTITNTATVTRPDIDPIPENNSSSVTTIIGEPFSLCLQADGGREVFFINTTTGDYLFRDCQGTTLTGRGEISGRGCSITLQHNTGDRRVSASVNTCQRTGIAAVQVFSIGRTFNITDRDTSNTCACSQ
ncbi:MAG TPA: DUF11 domain-containing protein [Blastocatellia bacterium]|nr:DUF11 domain-containing protein [Blastocatellia bacterium]